MKRLPYGIDRGQNVRSISGDESSFFSPKEWLDSRSAAICLGRFKKNGEPSVAAIHMLVYRKRLAGKKVLGRLMFHISEIQKLFEISPSIGG